MKLIAGVDVGTSAVKAIAVDAERGTVVASASSPLTLSVPRPGWAEQDPLELEAAAIEALAALSRKLGRGAVEVRAIGLTGQMHTAVLLDEALDVVRPAILWCDTRTRDQCAAIVEKLGLSTLAKTVGNRPLEGFTLPKLLWLREHERESFERIRHVLMPKDWIGLSLTGVIGTDDSDASGTLAFDLRARRWSEDVLSGLQCPASIFPASGSSTSLLGRLTHEASRLTGLPEGIAVARGAADNAAGAVGLGVVRAGRAMVSIGTSGVVLAPLESLVVSPEMTLHTFCHGAPDRHYVMGVMLQAGGALRWYRDVLSDGERLAAEVRGADAYEVLCEAASTSRIGAGGVVFLPYLMGERTPHEDASARAALIGMTARTTKADISRAVLEGITLGLMESLELVRAEVHPTEIRVTGGGAKSAFWRQLMADVFGAEIALTNAPEGPAFGAALIGGVAAELFPSLDEATDRLVHVISRVRPDATSHDRYRDVLDIYRGLYRDLRGRMKELARLD